MLRRKARLELDEIMGLAGVEVRCSVQSLEKLWTGMPSPKEAVEKGFCAAGLGGVGTSATGHVRDNPRASDHTFRLEQLDGFTYPC